MNLWKPVETALSGAARTLWPLLQFVNGRITAGSFQPSWSPQPLLKSWERTKPTLGWPRTTDSLCPVCVRETRQRILSGEQGVDTLVTEHVGEIKAQIIECGGRIVMEKSCPQHGTFVDTLAVNPAFLKRLEALFPGRDFRAVTDTLHNHGTSSIQHGRGAVLTIDLTNRCNMMCDPCFMDANQVGYVHELTLDEVKQLLDDAVSIKPRRQMSVQFSGGEPTVSPITGRDEDISDQERQAKRYTLSHLAEDVKAQTGVTEPLRDWFPLSASAVFSDVTDLLQGPAAEWGNLKCGCHPNCGVGKPSWSARKPRSGHRCRRSSTLTVSYVTPRQSPMRPAARCSRSCRWRWRC
jgi:uncharacterized radical SAM superfamily Fe-S cluster-containing enzyme